MRRAHWMVLGLGGIALFATTATAWTLQDGGAKDAKQDKPAEITSEKDRKPESAKPGDQGESPQQLRRIERQDDSAAPRYDNPQDLFREMEKMMRDLDHGWPQMRGLFDGRPFEFRFFDNSADGAGVTSFAPGTHLVVQQQGDQGARKLELSVKDNGEVVAEVTRDGKTEKIEAKTFADFRAAHGDLLSEFNIGTGRVVTRPLPDAPPRMRRLQPLPGAPAPVAGPKLGVRVSPISEDLAAYLELDDGVGLMVREVVSGSLAEQLGVKVNDVIAEIDGEAVTSTDVIARAVQSHASDVTMVVIRKANRLALHRAT